MERLLRCPRHRDQEEPGSRLHRRRGARQPRPPPHLHEGRRRGDPPQRRGDGPRPPQGHPARGRGEHHRQGPRRQRGDPEPVRHRGRERLRCDCGARGDPGSGVRPGGDVRIHDRRRDGPPRHRRRRARGAGRDALPAGHAGRRVPPNDTLLPAISGLITNIGGGGTGGLGGAFSGLGSFLTPVLDSLKAVAKVVIEQVIPTLLDLLTRVGTAGSGRRSRRSPSWPGGSTPRSRRSSARSSRTRTSSTSSGRRRTCSALRSSSSPTSRRRSSTP